MERGAGDTLCAASTAVLVSSQKVNIQQPGVAGGLLSLRWFSCGPLHRVPLLCFNIVNTDRPSHDILVSILCAHSQGLSCITVSKVCGTDAAAVSDPFLSCLEARANHFKRSIMSSRMN